MGSETHRIVKRHLNDNGPVLTATVLDHQLGTELGVRRLNLSHRQRLHQMLTEGRAGNDTNFAAVCCDLGKWLHSFVVFDIEAGDE